jgi:hypothetical protein
VNPYGLQRGQYDGQRLWILGSGPSLFSLNLDLLKEEIVLGVNGTHHAKNLSLPAYTFYGVIEHSAVERYGFGSGKLIHTLPTYRDRGWHLNPHGGTDFMEGLRRSIAQEDLSHVMESPSVCTTMLQVALWLGFSQTYTIGFENSGTGQVHTLGEGHNDEKRTLVDQHFKEAQAVFREHGRELDNLSLDPRGYEEVLT